MEILEGRTDAPPAFEPVPGLRLRYRLFAWLCERMRRWGIADP